MQKKSIKNIHLYPVNNKFNKSIYEIRDEDLSIINMPNNQSIIKYFYSVQADSASNNTFIFNSSIIGPEILDFINSFNNITNIWIFIDSNINEYISTAKYISKLPIENQKYKILQDHIVNKNLYENISHIEKLDQIVYFINQDTSCLEKIKNYLYPNTKFRIKLFDSDKFSHPQNLGYLTESARQKILLESKYYMHSSSNYYLTESLICGCIPINIDSNSSLEDQLSQNKTSKPETIIYYNDFIKEICDEQ